MNKLPIDIICQIYELLPFEDFIRNFGNDKGFYHTKLFRKNKNIELTTIACKYGYLNLVKYLYEKYGIRKILLNGLFEAAKYNHRELVKYMIEISPLDCKELAFQGVSSGGHFNLMFWILEKYNPTDFNSALSYACFYKQREMIEWLILHGANECHTCGFYISS